MTSYKDLITAKVVADSSTPGSGSRMTTMEIEYPRFILAELNTHRMLSKNSASSRAIPTKALLEYIANSPAGPVYWGRNKSGMSASEELSLEEIIKADEVWNAAKRMAIAASTQLSIVHGAHKQISNRIVEPWMLMKTVISGTEWANFFYLRDHPDAQPEIQELARKMRAAYDASTPRVLYPGEWHVPYVEVDRGALHGKLYYFSGTNTISASDAIKVSSSCCAQVSYRKNDDSLEKALNIYDKLINSKPAHASPVEHQASPMQPNKEDKFNPETWEKGISHISRDGDLWSGNLRGWIQHRKLIDEEAVWSME